MVRRLLKRLILYAFHVMVVRPVLIGVAGVRYRRRSVLPKGPCLVVSNHNSHLDAAVLMTMFPLGRIPRIHPVAAADYFGSNWFMRMWAMLFLNGIPIERKPSRGQDPLAPVTERLKAGETLIFFPEGSRGEAGVVARFRSGVGLIAKGVPGLLVVPVFLSGPERIWPRGRVIPVPLNIDVNIGKPRSYSVDRDPREIAEQVRRDVLALAPPPLPVPGARPRPPVRVAVCSVDDEHRKELHRLITARLGEAGKTEADGGAVHESRGPIGGVRRAWLRLLAGVFRTSGRFKGEQFVEMLERARADQAVEHGRDTRFVVADGSVLVELLAWTGAGFDGDAAGERSLGRLVQYLAGEKKIPFSAWWRFLRKAPEVWLINVLDLVRPPIPDVLVQIRLPVTRLIEDLRSRGEPLQPWQSEAFLERLQRTYDQVAAALRKRRRIEVVEIDVAVTSGEGAAERVAEVCRRLGEASRSA